MAKEPVARKPGSGADVPLQRLAPDFADLIVKGRETYDYVTPEGSEEKKLECAICMEPYVDPVLAQCDDMFCSACARDWADRAQSCPHCLAPLQLPAPLAKVPKVIVNALGELKCYCPRKSRGCDWTGPRSNVRDHMTTTCAWSHKRQEAARKAKEENAALEKKKMALQEKLAAVAPVDLRDAIKIDVGGKSLWMSEATLLRQKGSALAILVEQRRQLNKSDTLYIDRSPRAFELLLDFLRGYISALAPADDALLREEGAFWEVDVTSQKIAARQEPLIADGAEPKSLQAEGTEKEMKSLRDALNEAQEQLKRCAEEERKRREKKENKRLELEKQKRDKEEQRKRRHWTVHPNCDSTMHGPTGFTPRQPCKGCKELHTYDDRYM